MSGELAGRAALVTGAGQGLGYAIVRELSAEGARVAACDRAPCAGLSELERECDAPSIVFDAANPDAVRRGVAAAEHSLRAPVDILVVNHAVLTKRSFLDHVPDRWWQDIEVNLSAAFRLARAVIPGMKARRWGRLVMISSCWGVTGAPETTAYSASKAGLISLARSLAIECAPHAVSVNAIAPGTIDTPQLLIDAQQMGVSLDEARAEFAQLTPIGRIAEPREIARTVVYLASPRSGAVVGQVLQPNGGLVTGRA